MLWRVVFGQRVREPANMWAGPWHPDKAHAQRWADWFQARGQDAQVQSSADGGAVLKLRGAVDGGGH